MSERRTTGDGAGRGGGRGLRALVLAAGVAAILPLAARAAEANATTPSPAWAGMPEDAMEAIHGIRVTRVAVTAGGGLVDLRFTVVDPVKARPLLDAHARPPRLVVEGSGVELEAPKHGGMRGVRLQKDAASFLLFPNARNSIRPGTRVAVVFGDVKVEPVVAQ